MQSLVRRYCCLECDTTYAELLESEGKNELDENEVPEVWAIIVVVVVVAVAVLVVTAIVVAVIVCSMSVDVLVDADVGEVKLEAEVVE